MRRLAILLLLGMSISCRSRDREKSQEPADTAEAVQSAKAPAPTPPEDTTYGTARFRVTGDWEAAGNTGAAAFGAGVNVRKIEMSTTDAYRRQNKKSFIIQLLFSEDFRAQRRTYPISAKYLETADTAGATVIIHEDAITPLAVDPSGEVTFTEIGAHVRGRYRFEVYDVPDQGNRERKTVTVTGDFDARWSPQ